jgi:hypothetical protein
VCDGARHSVSFAIAAVTRTPSARNQRKRAFAPAANKLNCAPLARRDCAGGPTARARERLPEHIVWPYLCLLDGADVLEQAREAHLVVEDSARHLARAQARDTLTPPPPAHQAHPVTRAGHAFEQLTRTDCRVAPRRRHGRHARARGRLSRHLASSALRPEAPLPPGAREPPSTWQWAQAWRFSRLSTMGTSDPAATAAVASARALRNAAIPAILRRSWVLLVRGR